MKPELRQLRHIPFPVGQNLIDHARALVAQADEAERDVRIMIGVGVGPASETAQDVASGLPQASGRTKRERQTHASGIALEAGKKVVVRGRIELPT